VRLEELSIPGCFQLFHDRFADRRGSFIKLFNQDVFAGLGLRTDWREEYFSLSARGVIRGMHFQVPPHEHAKLVHCLSGQAFDVVLDLRRGSPTFGKSQAVLLDADKGNGIYIPAGIAHGFLALTDDCLMHYKVTSVHAAAADKGILWSSFGQEWPEAAPVLSERDSAHPPLAAFASPFVFELKT
jgi:dTDP-4-dehydrorhamnose 3,5-epimerase